MFKNVKLSSADFRWHMRTLGVANAQNINSAPRSTPTDPFGELLIKVGVCRLKETHIERRKR